MATERGAVGLWFRRKVVLLILFNRGASHRFLVAILRLLGVSQGWQLYTLVFLGVPAGARNGSLL